MEWPRGKEWMSGAKIVKQIAATTTHGIEQMGFALTNIRNIARKYRRQHAYLYIAAILYTMAAVKSSCTLAENIDLMKSICLSLSLSPHLFYR